MPLRKCVDEELQEMKVKLAKKVGQLNEFQKKNGNLSKPSNVKDIDLLTAQVILQQTRFIFEDLKKARAEIDKNLSDTIHGDIGGVNSARRKFEGVKDEYLKLLHDVDEGRTLIETLKNNLEDLKGETSVKTSEMDTSEDNHSYSLIKEKSDSLEEVFENEYPPNNTTFVYHTEVYTPGNPQPQQRGCERVRPVGNGPDFEATPSDMDPYLSYIFKIESENSTLKQQINHLQSELCKVTSNFGELQSSLGFASTENKARHMELEKLNNEVKILRNRICVADNTVQNLSDEMVPQNQESEDNLKKTSGHLNIGSLSVEFSPQKHEARKLQAELVAAVKKSEDLQAELKEAINIVRKLSKQVESKDREIENLQTAKYSLEKICSKETQMLKSSKSQEVNLAQKLLERSYQIETLLTDNAELKRKVDALTDDIESFENLKESTSQRKKEMTKRIEGLLNENSELSSSLDDTKSELSNTNIVLKRIENSLKSEQRNHSSTRAELMRVKKELAILQKKFSSHKIEKEDSKEKTSKLISEVETIANKLKDYEDKKSASESQILILMQNIEEMKRAYEGKLHEQNSKVTQAEDRCAQLEQQLNQSAQEVDNLKKEIHDLKKINNSLADECVKTGQDHFKLKYEKCDLIKKGELLESKVQSLKAEIDELRSFKAVQSSEIENLDSQLNQIKEEKFVTESQVKSAERRIASLTEQNKQLTLETLELEGTKANLKKELDQTKRSLRAVMSENFNIRLKMHETPFSDHLSEYSTDTISASRPETVIPKTDKITILNQLNSQFDPSEYQDYTTLETSLPRKSSTADSERSKSGLYKWPQCSSAPANMSRLNFNVYNVEFDIHTADDVLGQPVTHLVSSNQDYRSEDDFKNVFMNPLREMKSSKKLAK